MANDREVSIEEVQRLAGATIVDLRDDSAWASGHLPGATHVERDALETRLDEVLPDKEAPVVLYCGGGGRAGRAADLLHEMGYTNVRSMAGGWRAWQAAGLPTEKE
jgi:rhodanese-related sulfurtransferase